MPYIKPKRYKIECFDCGGKGFVWRVEPHPKCRCPNCGVEGQMVISDEMGESRKCANCNYETDTYETIKQYEKYNKEEK